MMAAAAVAVCLALTGALAQELLRPTAKGSRWTFANLPAAFGIGAGLFYFTFLCLNLFGPVSLGWLALVPAALLVCCWHRRRDALAMPATTPESPWGWLDGILLLALAVVVSCTIVPALGLPLFDWDARILWALKARLLAMEPSLAGEAFRDPYRLHIHPRYPVLVPWLAALVARVAGGFHEQHYQLLLCCYGLLTLGLFYRLSRRLVVRSTALLLTLVMTLTGSWVEAMFDSRVEIALVFYLLLAVEACCRWHDNGRWADLVGFGFVLFCLAMTKNEGWLLAAALLGASVLPAGTADRGWRKRAWGGVVAAAVLLACSLPWLWHQGQIPPVSDENYLSCLDIAHLQAGMLRLGMISSSIFVAVSNIRQWHLLWLAPLLLPVVLRRGQPGRPLLMLATVTLACYVAGVGAVYLISPWRDIGMQIAVTFDRIMLPLLPLLLILFAGIDARSMNAKGGGE